MFPCFRTKLYAACERTKDFEDCLAMKPTARELARATPWVKGLYGNVTWHDRVDAMVRNLEEKLGIAHEAVKRPELGQERLTQLRKSLVGAAEHQEDYDACVAMRPTKAELGSVLQALKAENHPSAWFLDGVVKRLEQQLGLEQDKDQSRGQERIHDREE